MRGLMSCQHGERSRVYDIDHRSQVVAAPRSTDESTILPCVIVIKLVVGGFLLLRVYVCIVTNG